VHRHTATTPAPVPGIDLSAMFSGPAIELVDMQFRPWPDGKGGFYFATFENGEVLEVHDLAISATLGVAMEQERPVHLCTVGEELVAVRLAPERQPPVAEMIAADLAMQMQLSLLSEDIAKALFDAAGIQAHQREAWPAWADVHPDVRETYRCAALSAMRKQDVQRRATAMERVADTLNGLDVEGVVDAVDQQLIRDRV
jgi:hypothetical protein